MAYWGEYVSAAERQASARREIAKLEKRGQQIEPVVLKGQQIAKSFWGKGWCQHLESFSDYSNRLPRGRTYVRNGSVCHLKIEPGTITALVSGTSLYHVTITITPLEPALWETIKGQCSGQVASLLELLRGQFSHHVMKIVTDRRHGLFPLPNQIKLDCDCPDGARMCKHLAAVLYGVGSRLDDQPEMLFRLRQVDPMELFAGGLSLPTASNSQVLPDDQLADLFGIELSLDP